MYVCVYMYMYVYIIYIYDSYDRMSDPGQSSRRREGVVASGGIVASWKGKNFWCKNRLIKVCMNRTSMQQVLIVLINMYT